MKVFAAAAMIAGFVASSASAQPSAEARLYTRANFSGPTVVVSAPRQAIGPIKVKSIQIPAGTSWDLCTGNTFTGCKTFSASDPAIAMTVRSVRPLAAPIPATATAVVAAQGLQGSAVSLRGLASEFFVIPEQGGVRVEAAGVGDASRVATAFCRSRGWRTSARERVQTVGGRILLADVLCANEDR